MEIAALPSVKSRGTANPRGVKRKMSNFPLRKRGAPLRQPRPSQPREYFQARGARAKVAETYFREALELSEGSLNAARLNLAEALERQGKTEQSMKLLEEYLQRAGTKEEQVAARELECWWGEARATIPSTSTSTSASKQTYFHPDVPEQLNLQPRHGEAKPYQIRQLLRLIERYNLRLEDEP